MELLTKYIDDRIKKAEVFIHFTGKVVSVDKSADICTVKEEDDMPEIVNVLLKSIITDAGNKMVVYPKVGSYVTVGIRHNLKSERFLVNVSEVDEIKWKVDKITLSCDEIVFNDGRKGGLVNWLDLKKELDKVNEYLKAIKQVLDGSPAAQPPNAPSVLHTLLKVATVGKMMPDFNNKEDTKIKH